MLEPDEALVIAQCSSTHHIEAPSYVMYALLSDAGLRDWHRHVKERRG